MWLESRPLVFSTEMLRFVLTSEQFDEVFDKAKKIEIISFNYQPSLQRAIYL